MAWKNGLQQNVSSVIEPEKFQDADNNLVRNKEIKELPL